MTELIGLPDGLDGIARVTRFRPEPDETRPRFALVPFDSIAISRERTYLVKGLVPRSGLTVLWGPPKCGKSFLAFDLMMHVALGWNYRGRRVQQGTVVYLALEGADGFRARAAAFRAGRLAGNAESVPFFLMPMPLNLIADHGALAASIRTQIGENAPVAITIDTLNRSLAGSESDDRDMANYVRAADAIRDAFGCAVVVIHHCGIDASRPRGHTSLTGAADAQISVKRNSAGEILATVEWMKDGPEGAIFASRLEEVEVGIDLDGDAITSCVVTPVEGAPDARKSTAGPRLTKGAKIALAALQKALGEVGEVPPASNHIPSGLKAVTVAHWREYAYRQGVSSSEEPRARQVAFQRAHETLLAAKQVAIWEPYAWPV